MLQKDEIEAGMLVTRDRALFLVVEIGECYHDGSLSPPTYYPSTPLPRPTLSFSSTLLLPCPPVHTLLRS